MYLIEFVTDWKLTGQQILLGKRYHVWLEQMVIKENSQLWVLYMGRLYRPEADAESIVM